MNLRAVRPGSAAPMLKFSVIGPSGPSDEGPEPEAALAPATNGLGVSKVKLPHEELPLPNMNWGLAEVPASVERKQGSATPMGNPIRQHIDVKNREEICVPSFL